MASLGTLKLTDSGVSFSRRGSVYLEVSFKDLSRWAQRNRVDAARLYNRSFGRACSALRAKMQKVVSRAGGVEGVPKFRDFEEFTRQLRVADNNSAPMGGVLSERHVIVAYKRNGGQVTGWPDRLAEWAVKFQDGVGGPGSEAMFTDPELRHLLHKKGLREIPRAYVHNPRPVIPEPFGSYVQRHLEEWARGAFYKELARQMAKAGWTT